MKSSIGVGLDQEEKSHLRKPGVGEPSQDNERFLIEALLLTMWDIVGK